MNLHMLDEATYLCLLPLLPNRTFSGIRQGMIRWTEHWGFPESVIADGEKGIASESMKVWLEEHNCELLPVPPAEGSRHTQFGIIDNHSKAVRGTVHRVDASLVDRKVKATAEELWAMVAWASNTSRGRCGVSPTQSAFGIVPRDPLNTHVGDKLTSAQMSQEDLHLEKIRTRGISLGIWNEEVAKSKIATASRAQAREGAEIDVELGVEKYEVGDEVEVHRAPGSKDLSGWRGPGIVVSKGPNPKTKEPGVRVAWQGGEDHVPFDQIRPFFGWIFWLSPGDVKGAIMFRISKEIEDSYELWGRRPTVLGTLRRGGYNIQAKATKDYPTLWGNILELAVRSGHPCEGAVVGGGAKGFQPVTNEPGILWLVVWPYRRPSALQTMELHSHWGVNMEKFVGPDWEDTAFFGIYSTLERLEFEGEDEKKAAPKVRTAPKGGLPTIPEYDSKAWAKSAEPLNRHEKGEWMPEELVKDPYEWTPIL